MGRAGDLRARPHQHPAAAHWGSRSRWVLQKSTREAPRETPAARSKRRARRTRRTNELSSCQLHDASLELAPLGDGADASIVLEQDAQHVGDDTFCVGFVRIEMNGEVARTFVP